jgi:hypothetical protein
MGALFTGRALFFQSLLLLCLFVALIIMPGLFFYYRT